MAEVEINFQPTRTGVQSAREKIKLVGKRVSLGSKRGLIRRLMG